MVLRTTLTAVALCTVHCALQSELTAQAHRDTLELDPIVVTATRIATPRTAVAATVTVLDGAELRAQGVQRVLDALRGVPGMNVLESGSFGSATSLFLRGGESDYVKVLIDGVPVNDAGGAFDFAHLTLDNVDRIEVLRGPASVLYGSDATVGVVEIFTRQGEGPPRGEVGARAGTFSSVTVDGGFTGATTKMSAAFGFSRSASEGTYAFNSDYDHVELSGRVHARPNDRTDASLMIRFSDGDVHFPTDGSGNVVDRNARQLQERIVGALNAGRFLTGWLETRAALAFNRTNGGIDDEIDGPADTLGFFGFQSDQRLERRSADLRANVYLPMSTVVTAGANFEKQEEQSTNRSQSQFGDSDGSVDVSRNNTAYYAQVQLQPVVGLGVNAGIRVDDNDAFGTFWTHRAGATYQLPSLTRVRASLGKAFKEPTFFENFSETPFAVGNPDLTPERSSTWELGVEQHLLEGHVRFGATYFDQRFEDLIQYSAAPPDPAGPYYFNVAKASASGLEVEGTALVGDLEVGTSYTYLDTEVTDAGFATGAGASFVAGEPLLRRPTHTASLLARYNFRDRARLGVTVHRIGERDDRDFSTFPATPLVLPAYTRVDLSLGVTLFAQEGRRPGLDLRGRVENLFDADYQEVFGFPARKRVVSIGARLVL